MEWNGVSMTFSIWNSSFTFLMVLASTDGGHLHLLKTDLEEQHTEILAKHELYSIAQAFLMFLQLFWVHLLNGCFNSSDSKCKYQSPTFCPFSFLSGKFYHSLWTPIYVKISYSQKSSFILSGNFQLPTGHLFCHKSCMSPSKPHFRPLAFCHGYHNSLNQHWQRLLLPLPHYLHQ